MIVGVIGANGFIGRHLCAKYISEKHTVYAFSRVNNSLIPSGCKLDYNSKVILDCLFIAVGNYSYTHDEFVLQIGSIGERLKSLNFKKLIYISSVSVYGKHKSPIKLNSGFNRPSIYGLSKISEESLISSHANFSIIRPTYIYGKGMNSNTLLSRWLNLASRGEDLIVHGKGIRKQDYLHVLDLVELCFEISFIEENGIYLAATGKSLSNKQVAEIICRKYSNSKIIYESSDNSFSYEFDMTSTNERLSWQPKMIFKDEIFNL